MRTETEMLTKAPLKVKFGSADYAIPILTILPSRDWRLKLEKQLSEIVDSFKPQDVASTTAFSRGLTGALIKFPEKVAELVLAYAGNAISREQLLDEKDGASEEQLAAAFSAIMEVAFPYLPQLAQVTQVMRASQRPSLPPMAKSSN